MSFFLISFTNLTTVWYLNVHSVREYMKSVTIHVRIIFLRKIKNSYLSPKDLMYLYERRAKAIRISSKVHGHFAHNINFPPYIHFTTIDRSTETSADRSKPSSFIEPLAEYPRSQNSFYLTCRNRGQTTGNGSQFHKSVHIRHLACTSPRSTGWNISRATGSLSEFASEAHS